MIVRATTAFTSHSNRAYSAKFNMITSSKSTQFFLLFIVLIILGVTSEEAPDRGREAENSLEKGFKYGISPFPSDVDFLFKDSLKNHHISDSLDSFDGMSNMILDDVLACYLAMMITIVLSASQLIL